MDNVSIKNYLGPFLFTIYFFFLIFKIYFIHLDEIGCWQEVNTLKSYLEPRLSPSTHPQRIDGLGLSFLVACYSHSSFSSLSILCFLSLWFLFGFVWFICVSISFTLNQSILSFSSSLWNEPSHLDNLLS